MIVVPPEKNTSESEQQPQKRELHSPRLYKIVSILIWSFTFGGFIPAIWAFIKKGYWWLNPVVQAPEWKNTHSNSLKIHIMLSLIWLAIVLFQCHVSVGYMIGKNTIKDGIRRFVLIRKLHKVVGYIGFILCCLFVITAQAVIYHRGVAGKLFLNGLGSVIGGGMMYHMTLAVRDIRAKNVAGHLWHVAGAMIWIAFPGMGRAIGLLIQVTVLNATNCDLLYTSGWMTPALILQVVLLHWYRYSMLGTQFKVKDYTLFFFLMVVDLLLAKADNSFLRCPEQPMMAQVPGRPWVLQNSTNSLYTGEAPWMKGRLHTEL